MSLDGEALERSLRVLRSGLDDETTTVVAGPSARLARVVEAADHILAVDSVGLLLLDEDGVLRAVASSGTAAAEFELAQQQLGVGPGIDAVATRRTIVVNDMLEDPRYRAFGPALTQTAVRAVISAPIHAAGQLVGNLNALAVRPRQWAESDVSAAEAFADVVGTVLGLSAGRPQTPAPDFQGGDPLSVEGDGVAHGPTDEAGPRGPLPW